MTPDDVAAIRATYTQYPVLALCDALEAAWAEQAALARVVYLGATETEQAVIDAARALAEWAVAQPHRGPMDTALIDAVRALDGDQ